jgi:hypothetical protein
MKTLVSFCILAGFVVSLGGQEAKIMIVEKSDSMILSQAYADYKDAVKRWETVKAHVSERYVNQKGKPMPGWEKIQYSADFRAIVPNDSQYAGHGYVCGANWPYSNIMLTTGNAVGASTTGSLIAPNAPSILGDYDIAPGVTVIDKH